MDPNKLKGNEMKKIIIIATLLTLLATNSYADCNGGACSDIKVQNLYAMSNGTITVETTGNELNLNCTSSGNGYVTVAPTDPGKNAIYSMLLTAQTTQKKVYIRVVDNSNQCRINYVFLAE